jgi:hypothetical protein
MTQSGILAFNFSFPAQEGSLSGQPLCFQALPIFVERLLRFFVIGQSLFRLDLSKRLSCFALRRRRFAPCNGFVFGHFDPHCLFNESTRGYAFWSQRDGFLSKTEADADTKTPATELGSSAPG